MRICIDVLGAPGTSGGMRLYGQEMVWSWQEEFPDDRLVVVGPAWIAEDFTPGPAMRLVRWPNDSALARIVGQVLVAGIAFWLTRSEAMLSVSSVVSPLVPRARRFCVIHDWRHLKNVDEFGFGQRLYRRFWSWSIAHAAGVVAISPKTLEETARHVPAARTRLIGNGADNARHWQRVDPADVVPTRVLTFGHLVNKRPELVIGAVNRLRAAGEKVDLVVLGARGEYRDQLRALAESTGYGADDVFPGFVSDTEYRRLLQTSGVVVMASTDEGFGTPVVEARYFGIPVVGTSDSGLDRIHDDVIAAEPTPEAVADAIAEALRRGRHAGARAGDQAWSDTVGAVRTMLRGQPADRAA